MSEIKSVLYVEDDQRNRRVMQMLMTGIMEVPHLSIWEDSTDFATKVAALDPAPNVILLDIHVPPLDGFEMLKVLREMEKFAQTPIVALTASVMNEEVLRLRTAGFSSVIAKPIDIDTFPGLLMRVLGGEQIWNVLEAH